MYDLFIFRKLLNNNVTLVLNGGHKVTGMLVENNQEYVVIHEPSSVDGLEPSTIVHGIPKSAIVDATFVK